jgi:hypothetical protein
MRRRHSTCAFLAYMSIRFVSICRHIDLEILSSICLQIDTKRKKGCDFFERVGEKRIHKTVFGLCVSDCEGLSSHKFWMGLSFHQKIRKM